MQISVTTKHEVEFQVISYMGGGMDVEEFGTPCSDIAQAIHNLELAQIKDPKEDWIIQCDVVTDVKGNKKD